jgi:hypothetical protein
MNERIRRMKEEIERRGGMLSLSEDLPDDVAEMFLEEVLNCPDCMAEAQREAQALKRRRLDH